MRGGKEMLAKAAMLVALLALRMAFEGTWAATDGAQFVFKGDTSTYTSGLQRVKEIPA
jgi:hypothetical protein